MRWMKKIVCLFLGLTMLASPVFADIPDKTVVIGDEAFNLHYANDKQNVKEIRSALAKNTREIIIKTRNTWFDNDGQVYKNIESLPGVIYTDGNGRVHEYREQNGNEIHGRVLAIGVHDKNNLRIVLNQKPDSGWISNKENFMIGGKSLTDKDEITYNEKNGFIEIKLHEEMEFKDPINVSLKNVTNQYGEVIYEEFEESVLVIDSEGKQGKLKNFKGAVSLIGKDMEISLEDVNGSVYVSGSKVTIKNYNSNKDIVVSDSTEDMIFNNVKCLNIVSFARGELKISQSEIGELVTGMMNSDKVVAKDSKINEMRIWGDITVESNNALISNIKILSETDIKLKGEFQEMNVLEDSTINLLKNSRINTSLNVYSSVSLKTANNAEVNELNLSGGGTKSIISGNVKTLNIKDAVEVDLNNAHIERIELLSEGTTINADEKTIINAFNENNHEFTGEIVTKKATDQSNDDTAGGGSSRGGSSNGGNSNGGNSNEDNSNEDNTNINEDSIEIEVKQIDFINYCTIRLIFDEDVYFNPHKYSSTINSSFAISINGGKTYEASFVNAYGNRIDLGISKSSLLEEDKIKKGSKVTVKYNGEDLEKIVANSKEVIPFQFEASCDNGFISVENGTLQIKNDEFNGEIDNQNREVILYEDMEEGYWIDYISTSDEVSGLVMLSSDLWYMVCFNGERKYYDIIKKDMKLEFNMDEYKIKDSIRINKDELITNTNNLEYMLTSEGECFNLINEDTYIILETIKAGTGKVIIEAQAKRSDGSIIKGKILRDELIVVGLPIPVEGISLKKEMNIELGKELKLVPNIYPSNATDKTLTWFTSNDSIVSVNDSGEVIGNKLGIAEITVMTDNGKTATCIVTVTPQFLDVSIDKVNGKTFIKIPDITENENSMIIKIMNKENGNLELIQEYEITSDTMEIELKLTKGIYDGEINIINSRRFKIKTFNIK